MYSKLNVEFFQELSMNILSGDIEAVTDRCRSPLVFSVGDRMVVLGSKEKATRQLLRIQKRLVGCGVKKVSSEITEYVAEATGMESYVVHFAFFHSKLYPWGWAECTFFVRRVEGSAVIEMVDCQQFTVLGATCVKGIPRAA